MSGSCVEALQSCEILRGDLMRHARTIITAGLSATLLVVFASPADARWGHRGYYGHGGYYGRGGYYGGGAGLVGGVVVGALTLATLPFALLGAATRPAPLPPPPPPGYYGPGYGRAPYGYGPPPSPSGYDQPYGPPGPRATTANMRHRLGMVGNMDHPRDTTTATKLLSGGRP